MNDEQGKLSTLGKQIADDLIASEGRAFFTVVEFATDTDVVNGVQEVLMLLSSNREACTKLCAEVDKLQAANTDLEDKLSRLSREADKFGTTVGQAQTRIHQAEVTAAEWRSRYSAMADALEMTLDKLVKK